MIEEENLTEQTSATQTTPEPSQLEVATMIAAQIGEDQEAQKQQIFSIVRALGRTQARALLDETLQIEAQGGMMLPDGSRRRTPGGVYFYLAYTKGQPKEGRKLVRPTYKKQRAGASPVPTATPKSEPMITFTWEDRITIIREAEAQKGTANVKITLVGRPGKIVDRGQCIVTVMESTKVPALPKGLPTPPATATKYTVYIASKQWKKVSEAIADSEDALIVEGFPTTDAQVSAIAVFATNVTTKKLQQAQKSKQPA
jgi:hypothetical protein